MSQMLAGRDECSGVQAADVRVGWKLSSDKRRKVGQSKIKKVGAIERATNREGWFVGGSVGFSLVVGCRCLEALGSRRGYKEPFWDRPSPSWGNPESTGETGVQARGPTSSRKTGVDRRVERPDFFVLWRAWTSLTSRLVFFY